MRQDREGNTKPCDCATGVGYRRGPNGTAEYTVFDVDHTEEWDEWYRRLPKDITPKLSLHDFKRLGELFKEVFNVHWRGFLRLESVNKLSACD